jgi:hypothetical protein
MDKKAVIAKARAFFENKIITLKQSVACTRQMAAEAPGRIASRYDSSREETSWLADGQAAVLVEWERNMAALAVLPVHASAQVQTGSLCLFTQGSLQSRMMCLICPGGSGFECEIDGETVTFLSPMSPLARAAAGKKAGDMLSLNAGNQFRIEEVC